MPIWFHLWMVLAVFIAVMWIVRLASMGRIQRKRCVLDSSFPAETPDNAPMISVLVAAKDEQDHIETCVSGLLEQDYPKFEVIVVDDRSSDRTPEILRQLQEKGDDRLRVLTVTQLREGWFGKSNAMREGISVSCGDWLLFTDADCRQTSARTLSIAMHECRVNDTDFLSITPVVDMPSVWERIIQPVCMLALMIWFLPYKVNNPKRKAAYANGAFMLLKRTCYDAIGGHEAVRHEMNEDIHMARLTKGNGLRLRVVENEDLYHTRMYDSPRVAWRGWSRIFCGSLVTLRKLAASATMIFMFCLVPWISLGAALLVLLQGDGTLTGYWLQALGTWLVVVLLVQITTWRVYSFLGVHPGWSIGYAIGAVCTTAMIVFAMLQACGVSGTTWRGTTYRKPRQDDEEDLGRLGGQDAPEGQEERATPI